MKVKINTKVVFSSVILVGAVGLLQAHGIEFWSTHVGQYGIAWSVMLELVALWFWFRKSTYTRTLGLLASTLLLLGPLYQIGIPILNKLDDGWQSDLASNKSAVVLKSKIDQLENQLDTYLVNSKQRSGWLPAIESTESKLLDSRAELASLIRVTPVITTQTEVQGLVIVVMEAIGLILFQLAAVRATLDLSSLLHSVPIKPLTIPTEVYKMKPRRTKRQALGSVPDFPSTR